MTVHLTVNVLPPGYGDPDELTGRSLYLDRTRFRIVELNEWLWLHLLSPTGVPLPACLNPNEMDHWVDGRVAHTDGLYERNHVEFVGLSGYYRLRGRIPWVHHEPGAPTMCAWSINDWPDIELGVRAARLIDGYLSDGADTDTTATMVALEIGADMSFRRVEI